MQRGYSYVAPIALTLRFRATGRKLKPSFIASLFCIPCKNEKQFNSIMTIAEAEGLFICRPNCSHLEFCCHLSEFEAIVHRFFVLHPLQESKQDNLIMAVADAGGYSYIAPIALTLGFRATCRNLNPSFIASFFCILCINEKQFNSIMTITEAEGLFICRPNCSHLEFCCHLSEFEAMAHRVFVLRPLQEPQTG